MSARLYWIYFVINSGFPVNTYLSTCSFIYLLFFSFYIHLFSTRITGEREERVRGRVSVEGGRGESGRLLVDERGRKCRSGELSGGARGEGEGGEK